MGKSSLLPAWVAKQSKGIASSHPRDLPAINIYWQVWFDLQGSLCYTFLISNFARRQGSLKKFVLFEKCYAGNNSQIKYYIW